MLNHPCHMTGPEDNLYGPYPYRKTNIWAIKLNKKEIIQAPSQLQQFKYDGSDWITWCQVGGKYVPFEKSKEAIAQLLVH